MRTFLRGVGLVGMLDVFTSSSPDTVSLKLGTAKERTRDVTQSLIVVVSEYSDVLCVN